MNLSDITLQNISDYIVGNLKFLGDKFRLLPKHEKEQILFRASQCPKECSREGKCFYCKCDYPEKLYVYSSCNKGKALPDLMDEEQWNKYKTKLKIDKNENSKLP